MPKKPESVLSAKLTVAPADRLSSVVGSIVTLVMLSKFPLIVWLVPVNVRLPSPPVNVPELARLPEKVALWLFRLRVSPEATVSAWKEHSPPKNRVYP